jgi:hypothetical protein
MALHSDVISFSFTERSCGSLSSIAVFACPSCHEAEVKEGGGQAQEVPSEVTF